MSPLCVTHVVLLCTGDGIVDSVPLCHFSSLPFNFVVYLENESSVNAWPMVARHHTVPVSAALPIATFIVCCH